MQKQSSTSYRPVCACFPSVSLLKSYSIPCSCFGVEDVCVLGIRVHVVISLNRLCVCMCASISLSLSSSVACRVALFFLILSFVGATKINAVSFTFIRETNRRRFFFRSYEYELVTSKSFFFMLMSLI